MKQWQQLLALLKQAAERKGITGVEIARRTGLARPNVVMALNGKRQPTVETFLAIANAIDYNVLLHDDDGTIDLQKYVKQHKNEENGRS